MSKQTLFPFRERGQSRAAVHVCKESGQRSSKRRQQRGGERDAERQRGLQRSTTGPSWANKQPSQTVLLERLRSLTCPELRVWCGCSDIYTLLEKGQATLESLFTEHRKEANHPACNNLRFRIAALQVAGLCATSTQQSTRFLGQLQPHCTRLSRGQIRTDTSGTIETFR
jgi:hypothetical protein